MAWPPQLLQIAAWYSRVPPGLALRAFFAAARHDGHRWGSLVRPLLAKNACSPDENTNDSPQSRQVRERSWYTPRVPPCGSVRAPVRATGPAAAPQEVRRGGRRVVARNSCANTTRAVKRLGRSGRALPHVGETLAGIVHETRLRLLEPHVDLAGRPVAMLRELELDDLAVGRLVVSAALLLAPQEHHEVRILLDRAGFSQVREPRLLRLPHLGLA